MDAPKFQLGQKVKFKDDPDRLTGEVLSVSYTTESGFMYKVRSRYFDTEQNNMVDGHITCREEELVDMSGYTGTTEPLQATQSVELGDTVNTTT